MSSKKKIYILVFAGLLISLFLNNYYVSKYDRYEISSDNIENHHMIKGDPAKYWQRADKLGKEIDNGKNFSKLVNNTDLHICQKKLFLFFLH